MSGITTDLFYPVWIIFGVLMCIKGACPWTIFILLVLSTISIDVKF